MPVKNAAMTAAALVRIMPNVGGPILLVRRLLVAVLKATLPLDSTRALSRTMALRLIRGFRTISDDAAHAPLRQRT